MSEASGIDVLVASGDRAFSSLARVVLRDAGLTVATTSARPERLRAAVRLRSPRLLLVEATAEIVAALAADPALRDIRVVRLASDAPDLADGTPVVRKWEPAPTLAAAVREALLDGGWPSASGRHLRLVES